MGLFRTFGGLGVVCAALLAYDLFTNHKKMEDLHKILWIVAGLVFSILTLVVYYFIVFKKK